MLACALFLPVGAAAQASPHRSADGLPPAAAAIPSAQRRARILGTAADMTVAVILAFGSAAAGSRLLWPVLLIAGYYAVGVLLTGTSPMVALLSDQPEPAPQQPPAADSPAASAASGASRSNSERRHQPRRTTERLRQRRGAHHAGAQ